MRKKKIPAVFKNIIVAKKKVQFLKSKMNAHVIAHCPISLNYGRVKLISVQIGFTGSFLSYKVPQFLFLFLKCISTPRRINHNIHPWNTKQTDRTLALQNRGGLLRPPTVFFNFPISDKRGCHCFKAMWPKFTLADGFSSLMWERSYTWLPRRGSLKSQTGQHAFLLMIKWKLPCATEWKQISFWESGK